MVFEDLLRKRGKRKGRVLRYYMVMLGKVRGLIIFLLPVERRMKSRDNNMHLIISIIHGPTTIKLYNSVTWGNIYGNSRNPIMILNDIS